MSGPGKRNGQQHQLRIIGGQWRGRKLSFTPAEGLRPTGDRIRETVFNWLGADIPGARCADLFAGSGALGLEALSRGADCCDFVDTSRSVISQIERHLETLEARNSGRCHTLPAEQFLKGHREPFDIVFIDPPFNQHLVSPICMALERDQLLSRNALIYIETGAKEPAPEVPVDWHPHREKISGGVAYRLFINSTTEN
jgi:16S rRNA (guanine966-N2)-methyltransferase